MRQTISDIDGGRAFDWGRASADYARFRDIYPAQFYERLSALRLGVAGQRVLDLGTGTGVLPRNMYRYGAQWTGADINENQIRCARKLTAEAGMDITYVVAAAEALPFPTASFDVITACQCFMYFDKRIVLPKLHALLANGGHLAIIFMTWLPCESDIAAKSEEIILNHNPDWTGAHWKRKPVVMPDWAAPLFALSDAVAYDVSVRFTRESWHGRIRASRGIGASSLSDEAIVAWEAEHTAYLATVPHEFDIPHYVTVLNLERRSQCQ